MERNIKSSLFAIVVAICCFSVNSYGQTYIPAVRFYYDAVGERIVRKMKPICIGTDCPVDLSAPKLGLPEDTTRNSAPGTTEIEAYPNPVLQELCVNNHTWKEGDKASVVVYDVNGRVVVKKDLTQAKDNLPFRELTPGAYMVQYYLSGAPMQEWKIIKL